MRKVEVLLPRTESESVKDALLESGIEEVVMSELESFEGATSAQAVFLGQIYVPRILKTKIELIVSDGCVETILHAIRGSATGERDAIRVFVSELGEVLESGAHGEH
jgi:nitrogen regulatory protein PII